MKLAALTPLAAIAIAAALAHAAPIIDTQAKPRALSDKIDTATFIGRRAESVVPEQLVARTNLNVGELGSKAMENGRGALPDGIAGLDSPSVNLMGDFSMYDDAIQTQKLARMRQVAAQPNHRLPKFLTDKLRNARRLPQQVVITPMGNKLVESSPNTWHLIVPPHLAESVRPDTLRGFRASFVQTILNRAGKRAQDMPVRPVLHLHFEPRTQSSHVQPRPRSVTHVPATREVDVVDVPSSSSEADSSNSARKRPSPSSAQAVPSTLDVQGKGKGITTDAIMNGKHKDSPKHIQTRPWLPESPDLTPRLGSTAKPNSAAVLDNDLDTELRLAKLNTELRLAPSTPLKPNERPVLSPEQSSWLQKDDLALPVAKKQRQT